ncbi:MAG TPA: NAD(P)-dependent oxidoreductase, partial [Euzebyales bacterium]|nr:NAD(P)-dependent oxidoreductase [Euzebyales bacterium]
MTTESEPEAPARVARQARNVAFIGLGAMGNRMAGRLLDAGHDLVVWNRTPNRATPLVDRGARLAATPREAATDAEVTITMVADPEALRAVVDGPDGIAAGVTRAATVSEMSTVGPAAVAALAATLPDGVGLLDAPVLGSIAEAAAGDLQVFAGGPTTLVERWTPLLSTLGTVHRVGPLGSGAASKLVANATLFGVLGVLGEVLALGQVLGLPVATTFDVLSVTPLAAQAQRRRAAIEADDFPPRFALSLARKDAGLVADAAMAAGADLRLAQAALTWLGDADDGGWVARLLLARRVDPRPRWTRRWRSLTAICTSNRPEPANPQSSLCTRGSPTAACGTARR